MIQGYDLRRNLHKQVPGGLIIRPTGTRPRKEGSTPDFEKMIESVLSEGEKINFLEGADRSEGGKKKIKKNIHSWWWGRNLTCGPKVSILSNRLELFHQSRATKVIFERFDFFQNQKHS